MVINMMVALSIELFRNLVQYEYNHHHYDFHNDYNCEKISYNGGILLLLLKSVINDAFLSLKFIDVRITAFDFFNGEEAKSLTLDNLYRGRFEFNGKLIEVSEDGKGFFYLEFYEGQKLEFWAKSINIEE